MSETNENDNPKRKKRRAKTKNKLNEEGEKGEENEIKIKKKKKRSKTTKKLKIINDIIEDNENEENEEKPKRKKRVKRKKEVENEDEKNISNEENENEEKTKKKKKKKRKKPQTDDENENENNIENDNDEEEISKSKKKKKKRKKIEENDENIENNEENEEESAKKKNKKKKKKGDEEEDNDNNNFFSSNDVTFKFYKTAKALVKKKKKKKVEEEEEDNDNNNFFSSNNMKNEFYKTAKKLIKKKKKKTIKKEDDEEEELPTLSQKLKTKKKRGKTKEKNENEEIDEDNDENNNDNDINNFDNSDEKWPIIKKKFLTTIEDYINEISLYEHIDIALVSKIYLTKKEYGNFKLTKHHEIYPIKNYNNINWIKEPYRKLQDKFYELSAPDNLISKNSNLDFSNRVCNEYEIYTAQIQMIKVSGNNINEKVNRENIFFLPKEEEKIIMKPYLLLFFSFDDEKSILFYKEVLEYLKENEEKVIFIPVYAPLIHEPKNIYYVTEMLDRYKVYKKGDKFNIYFCTNDALSKRFKYISDDNKKTITCKMAFIDLINNKFVVRAVRDLDSFTFNLIDSNNQINKKIYRKIKKNLQNFKNNSINKLKNTSLMEPYNCNWILKKAKIYTILNSEKKLKLKYTLYDSLTGVTNCHNLYKSEENYQNLCEVLNDLFYYKVRLNPKRFKLTNKQINNLIIEEMTKCIKGKEELQNITYQGIFQTQKIIMSLGSEFDIEQKFEPIKSKSFKLEIHINNNLFNELNPMTIIGSLYGLTLFTYFNNCDYICCLPKIGDKFPNKLNLTDPKSLKDVQIPLNQNLNKPSLLIIFSLAFQNYFASSELSSRFKLIIRKLNTFFKKEYINIILIYRGEPSLFKQRFDQIKDDPIFDFDFPLFILSSADMKFPLLYQNNDIESTDSQIMTYILNKNNNLVYTGNLEDIELDKTFQKLCEDKNGKIDDILVYKEYANLTYDNFKIMIKPKIKSIEKIIEEEIKKENTLLYRPFFSLSYNCYTNFENSSTDNQKYINHIRLRILIKQKHENIFIENSEFKNIIAELKKYGASTIVMNIPCEDIEFLYHCSNCEKKIIDIDENNPVYYDEESKKIFCEKCGNEFSKDIKNDTYVTFFNTKYYTDEVISEIYQNYNRRDTSINPILGNTCKICQCKIGDCYYLNLTNFNIEYIESPLTPIDICQMCFEEMRNGEPFLNDPLKRLNYEKFGLNYKQMIYRKIYIPLDG